MNLQNYPWLLLALYNLIYALSLGYKVTIRPYVDCIDNVQSIIRESLFFVLSITFDIYYNFVKRKCLHYKITKDILLINCILLVLNETIFSIISLTSFIKDAFCESSVVRKYKYIELEKVKNIEEILFRKLDSIPDYIIKPKAARFACYMNERSLRHKLLEKKSPNIPYSFSRLDWKLSNDSKIENEKEIEDKELDPKRIGYNLMKKEIMFINLEERKSSVKQSSNVCLQRNQVKGLKNELLVF